MKRLVGAAVALLLTLVACDALSPRPAPITAGSAPHDVTLPASAIESPAGDAPTAGTASYYKRCKAARAAGAAPLRRGESGYRRALDADGDGTACE